MLLFLSRKQRLFLTGFAIFYLSLFVLYRFRSARDPGSFFFQPGEGYRPTYSVQRIRESLEYLRPYNQSFNDPLHPQRNFTSSSSSQDAEATLCVGIVTVKRPIEQKIDTTVASILDNLSEAERAKITVHVLFALTSPTDHPDYNHPWLPNVVDRVLTYEQTDAHVSTLRRLEEKKDIKRKSIIDYHMSLKSCYEDTSAPWIMMLEDDVVAQRGWYNRTMQSLNTVQSWRESGEINNWLYLRLFYTEKFLGWNSENWPIYLAYSVAAVTFVAFAAIQSRRSIRPLQGTLTNQFIAIICLSCVPLLIILYFLAGRVTMLPLQPGIHKMNAHGCCSQALVFPRDSVPDLLEYMGKARYARPLAVDSVIERMADANDLDRYAIVPSQMQHVGAASFKENRKSYGLKEYGGSGPHAVQGAHGVWSMGFEKALGEE
ncbi:uncharacterized protein BDV14DRAFT_193069 [Aspergillus stella-maris]|uniref:uncharacterized protein n=1 Tax=Aspergillus stella-maris TaxID=1810926 RepID=UPI003CCDC83C